MFGNKYVRFISIICLSSWWSTALADDQQSSHYIGASYQGATVDLMEVEAVSVHYEYRLNPNWGIHVSYSDFEYEYEDDEEPPYYEYEEGEGFSIEAAFLYYPNQSGLFFGGGIGGGEVEWDYIERDGFIYVESDDAFGYEIFGRIGYKFEAGPIFVTPSLQLGNWFSIGEEVGVYGLVGLSVGAHF